MTKIEEVARAIARAHHSDDGDWIAWTGEARAAIEAMREPTEAMLAAGELEVTEVDTGDEDSSSWQTPKEAARETWQSMIDAALAEGPK